VTFTSGTRGRLDFGISFSLGTGFTGPTVFSWTLGIDTATNTGWATEPASTTGTTLPGATGTVVSSIAMTPGAGAGATRLSLRITGTPPTQDPIDITYTVPLRVV